MSGDFLDTNVLVYVFDPADRRSSRAADVVRTGLASGSAQISSQVVQETLHVITSKLPSPATIDDADRFLLDTLAPLWKVMPTPALYRRALSLQERYHYHFYDSLILAAALEAGCDRLISEDFQHGQTIDGLSIHNPFL